MNYLSEILRIENDTSFNNEQCVSNDKGTFTNTYSIVLRKIVLKYEASIYKDSYIDVKDFILFIEPNKFPNLIFFKIKLPDFQMTIENGDELLYFSQIISAKYPEIVLDIDETRRMILKSSLYYNLETPFFAKIIETIDKLIILSVNFYIVCIRSMFYYKPTKDTEKYEIFMNLMKECTEFHLKEMSFIPKWNKIKRIFNE